MNVLRIMTDRLYWYSTMCLKSVYLSKNRCDTIKTIPTLHQIKINVFFSRKSVRSTILIFWFLFFIFGYHTLLFKLQNPSQKVSGLGSKQVVAPLKLRSQGSVWAFLDYWTTGCALTNLIYLKKRVILGPSLHLGYSTIPRPSKIYSINSLDKGYDYYLTRVGHFDLIFSYTIRSRSLKEINLHRDPAVAGVELEDAGEALLKGLTKNAISFYCSSLGV